MCKLLGACIGLLFMACSALAVATVPGENIVGGGSFEDLTKVDFTGASGTVSDYRFYKHLGSPLTQAEIDAGTSPVRPWQFHPDYDLGRWMPVWGIGDGGYDAQIGISVFDDPRSLWNGSDWTDNVSTNNISVDPLNPSNRVMEGVYFRSWVGQIMKAPVNHVAGTATIDFDYYFNNWTGLPPYSPGADDASIFHVFLYGVTEQQLPTWQQRWGPHAQEGDFYQGPNGAANIWTSPDWNEWDWTGPGSDEPDIHSLGNQWNHFSTDHPTRASFEITTPYPYYYIAVWQCVYSEPHEYFWYYGGRPADAFAVAIDNIEFRLPVPLGDVNQDANVNALDIGGFVSRLTMGAYQIEADINRDGLVNALDIAGFVSCLTGSGLCASGDAGAVVPEPAALAMLLASLLFRPRWLSP